MATAAIALLAGGDLLTAARLGGSMVALQASIGSLNDVVDAPSDAGRKAGKPIPAGVVTPGTGRAMVAIAAGLGLLLALPSGPGLVALACVGLAIGYGYDLLAKGTSWSWLPFAVGIPLLPVFGWFGATGRLPAPFAILLPVAVMAGAALAIANARADLERDMAAGLDSVAVRLGQARAWTVQAALLGFVVLIALASVWLAQAPWPAMGAAIGAAAVIGVGIGWAYGRAASAARRERAWEIQAVGVALLAGAWMVGARVVTQ